MKPIQAYVLIRKSTKQIVEDAGISFKRADIEPNKIYADEYEVGIIPLNADQNVAPDKLNPNAVTWQEEARMLKNPMLDADKAAQIRKKLWSINTNGLSKEDYQLLTESML